MSRARRLQITIVTKEAGEMVDQVIDSILNDLFGISLIQPMQTQSLNIFQQMSEKLQQTYYPSYDLYQVKCYQQHIGNFCGYHATFASVCLLQIIEKHDFKNSYQLNNGASFWTFKKKIQSFLFQYRKLKNMDSKVWPWRDNDILYGDFQRTYNQILKNHSTIFHDFKSNEYFEFMQSNWQYQYKNLVCDQQSRIKLGEKIQYFKNYKKAKPLIFVMMLGITNHWTCFLAIKIKKEQRFWFIDSKNREFLDFSVTQISVLINAFQLKRIEEGKPAWEKYQKQIYEQAMIDTQISLKLIVQLLKGEQNIHQYHFNRMFEIFAEKYQQFMYNQNKQEFLNNLIVWVTDYKHNLRGFFANKVDVKSLYQANHNVYKDMVKTIVRYSRQSRDLGIISNYIIGAGNL